jgi:hypothetical protein
MIDDANFTLHPSSPSKINQCANPLERDFNVSARADSP